MQQILNIPDLVECVSGCLHAPGWMLAGAPLTPCPTNPCLLSPTHTHDYVYW